jgi:hypothetical protein
MSDRTSSIGVHDVPIIFHTGFGGRSGLIGPAGPLPAGAAFDSGSAMCGVEVFSSLSRPKISRWSGKAEVVRSRLAARSQK